MTAIIILGLPGSGKGTQAKLLADKFNMVNFDTGGYLRQLFNDSAFRGDKTVRKEKLLNEAGKLNTPEWVLKIIDKKAEKMGKLGESVVFSGSPRTVFEAFGDGKNKGLMDILKKFYGRKNIFVFELAIPAEESIKRNVNRLVCSVCRVSILRARKNAAKPALCPFCGGRLKPRFDDKKEIILQRLKEYKEKTGPIVEKLKKKGYRVFKIDGRPAPYEIHRAICGKLEKFLK